jgi:lipoprotein
MKKILYILLVLGLIACSKKDSEQEPDVSYTPSSKEEAKRNFEKELPNGTELIGFYPISEKSEKEFLATAKKEKEFYFYKIKNGKIIAQYKEILPETIDVEINNNVKKIRVSEQLFSVYINDIAVREMLIFSIGAIIDNTKVVVTDIIFTQNQFKKIISPDNKTYFISHIEKRGDYGYIISKGNVGSFFSHKLLYDSNFNFIGKIENSFPINDTKNILLRNKNEVIFIKVENDKIIEQYKDTIPKKVEFIRPYGEKEIFNTADYKIKIIGISEDNIMMLGLFDKNDIMEKVSPYIWIYHNRVFKHLETKEKILNADLTKIQKWGEFGFYLSGYNQIMYDINWNYSHIPQYIGYYGYLTTPISIDEFIFTGANIERVNTKIPKRLWKIENVYSSLPENIRLDKIEISKNGEIWTVKSYYTLYSGEKGMLTKKININEGRIID